jgi:dethiobiotin synthetase/adenosylmethionine--8-amino-7-oxononanoate aminotransferase
VLIFFASPGYRSSSAQGILAALKDVPRGENLSSAPGGGPFGINFRTLGDVAYFMLSLNMKEETVREVENRIWAVVAKYNKK